MTIYMSSLYKHGALIPRVHESEHSDINTNFEAGVGLSLYIIIPKLFLE